MRTAVPRVPFLATGVRPALPIFVGVVVLAGLLAGCSSSGDWNGAAPAVVVHPEPATAGAEVLGERASRPEEAPADRLSISELVDVCDGTPASNASRFRPDGTPSRAVLVVEDDNGSRLSTERPDAATGPAFVDDPRDVEVVVSATPAVHGAAATWCPVGDQPGSASVVVNELSWWVEVRLAATGVRVRAEVLAGHTDCERALEGAAVQAGAQLTIAAALPSADIATMVAPLLGR